MKLLYKNNKVLLPEGNLKKRLKVLEFYFQQEGYQLKSSRGDFLNGKFVECFCVRHEYTWKQNPKRSEVNKCRMCSIEVRNNKNRSDPIESLRIANEVASSKNGKCLSEKYLGWNEKLIWKCHDESHEEFLSTWTAVVKIGRWCPSCANNSRRKGGSTEEKIRRTFEIALKEKFSSVRPKWNSNQEKTHPYILEIEKKFLKIKNVNRQNYSLEIDGLSNKLGIGFEFNGKQHYELAPYYFSKNLISELANIVINDWKKEENCKLNGIELLTIPYHDDINVMNVDEFLKHINRFTNEKGVYLTLSDNEKEQLEKEFKFGNKNKNKDLKMKKEQNGNRVPKNIRFSKVDLMNAKLICEKLGVNSTSIAVSEALQFYIDHLNLDE